MAVSMSVRGAIEDRRGLLEDARSWFERSLASAERTCHRLHEDIAIGRSQLGDVLRRLGESEEALRKLRHAQGEMDRVCGQHSRLESHVEAATAALLHDQGSLEEARCHAERSVSALDGFYPPDHPYLIPALNLLARIDRARGDAEHARGHVERALALGAVFGGEHPDLAHSGVPPALPGRQQKFDSSGNEKLPLVSRSEHRERESLDELQEATAQRMGV
jgi:tetratricopeptide (TPR) repeat protein